jgi:hypothetical protein
VPNGIEQYSEIETVADYRRKKVLEIEVPAAVCFFWMQPDINSSGSR